MFFGLKKSILLVSLCLSICAGTFVRGMEDFERQSNQKPTPTPLSKEKTLKKTSDETPQYVTFAQVRVTNYCRMILDAIKRGDDNQINKAFVEFFSKIPYNMQNISPKDDSNKESTKNLYYALCYWLSLCLEDCSVNGDAQGDYETTILASDQLTSRPCIIYVPLCCDGHEYVLQFCVCNEKNPRTESYRFYDYIHDGKTVKTIYITVALDENGFFAGVKNRGDNLIDEEKMEDDGRESLIKEKKTLIKKEVKLLNVDAETPYNVENIYTASIDQIQHEPINTMLLKQLLEDQINELDDLWKPSCEKFFHNLFANTMRFVGVGYVETEITTLNGRIDIVLYQSTGKPIIFELKYNKSTQMAVFQIDDRKYYTVTDAPSICLGVNLHVGTTLESTIEIQQYFPVDLDFNLVGPTPLKTDGQNSGAESQGPTVTRKKSEKSRKRKRKKEESVVVDEKIPRPPKMDKKEEKKH